MQINILKIKSEIDKLNNLIEDYEVNYLNLYNEINKTSSLWQDNNAKKFFKNIDIEKRKAKQFIDEVNYIIDIYKFLVKKYEKIGKKISINIKAKDEVVAELNKYLDQLQNIINYYNNLDLSFCLQEQNILLAQKQKLKEEKQIINKIKEGIKAKYNYIEEIEKQVNSKILKLDIEILKVTEINNFI